MILRTGESSHRVNPAHLLESISKPGWAFARWEAQRSGPRVRP